MLQADDVAHLHAPGQLRSGEHELAGIPVKYDEVLFDAHNFQHPVHPQSVAGRALPKLYPCQRSPQTLRPRAPDSGRCARASIRAVLDLKSALKRAVEDALPAEAAGAEVAIQETPPGKPGDYGTPVAFTLAKALRQNPAQIAASLAERIRLPEGFARAETVGPYLNFFVDRPSFLSTVSGSRHEAAKRDFKVVIEHTSVNPNKEWHVGHIRGALIGDAMARLHRAAGYDVEVQNYIDDTGRQAADSLFAAEHYGEQYDDTRKFDHWLGELYVRLHRDLEDPNFKAAAEPRIGEVIHRLERGELRTAVERVVRAHLQTAYSLGIEYDLLTWESDIVRAGFVEKALAILEASPHVSRPNEGKYAGTLVIDLSSFVPGLEEPLKVLVRSNGTFVYETKDIANQYWKFGLFEGLDYALFEKQPSGRQLWSSVPQGTHEPERRRFAHANEVINVIDTRQSLAQSVVRAALAIDETGEEASRNSFHLDFETVLLEGKPMSGRKGITVAADDVIAEAQARALAVVQEKNPTLAGASDVARQVGVGALRFAFLKTEPGRQIDFRWDQALSLQGDSAPVVQYAHARARSIIRKALAENGGAWGEPDWAQAGPLEVELARVVARLPEVITVCLRERSPHPMAQHALDLAAAFNAYYNHKGPDGRPDTSVLGAPAGLREARLAIVRRVADAIEEALDLLGIEAPQEM
jgi:arginyl-tRNA synthetase